MNREEIEKRLQSVGWIKQVNDIYSKDVDVFLFGLPRKIRFRFLDERLICEMLWLGDWSQIVNSKYIDYYIRNDKFYMNGILVNW